MNEDNLISRIEDLGLSNKEARVYVASLKLGPSPVQRIADQSGIKRVTTYVILESLVGLGLISQSIKGKKTFFVAEEPHNLERLLEKRQHELEEQQSNFQTILPQLVGLKTVPKELPEVKFYEGVDGVRALQTGFYPSYKGSSKTIYGISNIDQLNAFFPERGAGPANPDRLKYGIASKMVYTSERGAIYSKYDAEIHRESRFVPLDKYPLTGEVNVLGEYVILISLVGERPIGITVRNYEIANAMKAIFDVVWDAASASADEDKAA